MAIVLEKITKAYGDHVVVSGISLEIQTGELFVLLGASGSGKSTVLRLIAGLQIPDSGKISLDEKDVTFAPAQERNVGFVFQNYALFRHMTVAQNVEFGLRVRGVPAIQRKRRRNELLEIVGLTGLDSRLASQLSGGQRQRVALARALAFEPSVLLLDEPFGALDARIRLQLRRSLQEIQRELKVTTILVTHDQEEAFELGERIALLDRGIITETGSPRKLYFSPDTEHTATFFGGGNVIVGRSEQEKVRLGSNLIPFPPGNPIQEDGAAVRVLFRPESVNVRKTPFDSTEPCSLGKGVLREKVFTGATEKLRIELESLRGTRPLTPQPLYGEKSVSILATRNASDSPEELTLGEEVFVALRDYHVLKPTGLKLLVAAVPSVGDSDSVQQGRKITELSHGSVTVLGSCSRSNELEKASKDLAAFVSTQFTGSSARVFHKTRVGNFHREIVLEAQEGLYDLIILPKIGFPDPRHDDLELLVSNILSKSSTPVMLAASPRPLQRVLICTAAGEPGKRDVLFGARLGRHTRSSTTVMHVLRDDATEQEKSRAERHLTRAQALLESYNVSCVRKLKEGDPIYQITEEAKAGKYDLVLLGASGRTPSLDEPQFSMRVGKTLDCSLVIIPSRL